MIRKDFCNLSQEQAIKRGNSVVNGSIKYDLFLDLKKGEKYEGKLTMSFEAKSQV